jgi:16S rRNA (guanine527-N7)-methyltransferase
VIERLAEAARRPVSRETFGKLQEYAALLREASTARNLIAASTLGSLWDRHILDSAQLVRFEPHAGASWADVGSGAGLPGIVIACLVQGPVTLIEPRRLRADFLRHVSETLKLNVAIHPLKVERVTGSFDVITGRAVAPLSDFLRISRHLSTGKTVWALPKGRKAENELAEARRTWQGMFHVEQSVTDPDSKIVVGSGVRAK